MNSVQAVVLQTTIKDHYSIGLRISVNTDELETPRAPTIYTDQIFGLKI